MGSSVSGRQGVFKIMAPSVSTPPILQIENLTVAYQQGTAWLDAVRDFSLQIEPGQTYGLVGESGSGKTTIAMAVMRYLGEEGRVLQGRIALDGRDLLALSENQMRQVWGAQMSLVPQNPLSSLNPSIRIGEQLAEGLRFHEGLDRASAERRVIQLLRLVRLPEPEVVANNYPHQISGGMQQRILIAMALSTSPRLLVLDEPTTSLDVTTQASILDLFRDLIQGIQSAVLYVTHNLGVVAQICDRVAVLYAGELVEDAPLKDLFSQPLHPYTRGLLDCVPKLGQNKNQVQLQSIQGQIPPQERGRAAACLWTAAHWQSKYAVNARRCSPRIPGGARAAIAGRRLPMGKSAPGSLPSSRLPIQMEGMRTPGKKLSHWYSAWRTLKYILMSAAAWPRRWLASLHVM